MIRGRVLPAPPLSENFEGFDLTEDSLADPGVKFAYPPLPWIGARFKFEVRERDGSNVLRKTIENKRLQRATVFIGEQSMSNYTVQADVLTDGRRRKMSDVGIINQRYYIVLKGNEQKIEINSNLDRIRVPERGSSPNYRWKANTCTRSSPASTWLLRLGDDPPPRLAKGRSRAGRLDAGVQAQQRTQEWFARAIRVFPADAGVHRQRDSTPNK